VPKPAKHTGEHLVFSTVLTRVQGANFTLKLEARSQVVWGCGGYSQVFCDRLIAAGISVAIIAVVSGLGSKLNTKFDSISTQLE